MNKQRDRKNGIFFRKPTPYYSLLFSLALVARKRANPNHGTKPDSTNTAGAGYTISIAKPNHSRTAVAVEPLRRIPDPALNQATWISPTHAALSFFGAPAHPWSTESKTEHQNLETNPIP